MKYTLTILILFLLSVGCSKPFSEGAITSKASNVVEEPNLIKIDVSQVETPTTETTDSTQIVEETIEITSNLTLPTESTTVSTQVITEHVEDKTQEIVNQVEASVPQNTEHPQQPSVSVENQPTIPVIEAEPEVLTNVVYIAEELTSTKTQEELTESETLPVPSVSEMLPTQEPIDLTEPFVVDEALKEELDKAIFSDEASKVTVVSYQKKEGSFEEYAIYTQNIKDLSLVKEFSVFVKDGKVQIIQSLNNKNIESFSTELNEIVSLEKKFKELVSSEEIDSIKESTVAQFVKNKKDKKTSKIKNKKFGKKSKKHKRKR